MNTFEYFNGRIGDILEGLAAAGVLQHVIDAGGVTVEPPRDVKHGDISTNAAMVLAKAAGLGPRELAEKIAAGLEAMDEVASVEVAGPGFINATLAPQFWYARLGEILAAGIAYGDSNIGAGRRVNVEYVSANPTGPMHVGHGRGAVVGDALAAILAKAGYDVMREYYVNDAGAQVEALARSLHLRYRECLGEVVTEFPEGLYPGAYLVPAAEKLKERDGDKWLGMAEEEWLQPFSAFATQEMMTLIRGDLAALGVEHGVFFSERDLVERGGVDEVVSVLEGAGLVYTGTLEPPKGMTPEDWEPRPQLLFKATEFGDDVDRPLRKSDGTWTYFATDMAYHLDKHRRGFTDLIDVWGADHGGYVKRMNAAVTALTGEKGGLHVILCQMVNLLDRGEPVKMSKRSGTFVTLAEVIDQVGKDVVRFIMLTRKNDAQLDFDLAKVVEQSRDNPVFYVQYSHARCCSVLRHAARMFDAAELSPDSLQLADFSLLADPAELQLIKSMAAWPRMVEGAAEALEPHRIAYFLNDLSASFHALWTKGARQDESLRFLVESDKELSRARLALVKALELVIASGLTVMGVTPVQEM
ncbi:MAG: arginine--tRNA ligase [Rhodospirillales bacterium]|jgi:arginyl-tRNA synthetase|nr:arginine--tRNA ligase [Rhodospirillaceae bacterium]MDP6428271.1 arginine--tRNA ligase [Rhodospirillales bacterium]MDP6646136.1 arginine--tRNA ligase [Rhodospirillales bacterium]MDP6840685.1 arginine--tRNA ligase [Rhodospirillales bacterium]